MIEKNIFYASSKTKCKNENECKFDPRKCWFVHQQDIEMAYFNAKNEGQNKIHQSEL